MNDEGWGSVLFNTICLLAVIALFGIVLIAWTAVPPEALR